jgi:2'-5' RNA ligase
VANLAIVAIPAKDEWVWDLSTEKVPHLTLLYFGDQIVDKNTQSAIDFVRYAAENTLNQFALQIDRRGVLGDKKADVLFLKDRPNGLEAFRSHLLKNIQLFKMYRSIPQYDGWIPHVTLGFPETPAEKDYEWPGDSLLFDRLAFWTGDYEGPTFKLKTNVGRGGEMSQGELTHYGVKGMRWGHHKAEVRSAPKPPKAPKPPAHDDAVRAKAYKTTAKRGTTDALSTQQLQELVTRMNLEQQYGKLRASEPTKLNKGQKRLKSVLAAGKTVNEVVAFVNSPAGKLIKERLG